MPRRPPLVRVLFCLLLLATLLVPVPATAQVPPVPPATLTLPMALGGECRLLLSCPFSGPLAAHFRLGGLVWMGQEDDPRPLTILPFAALSTSLWRWAEAGVVFSGRGGGSNDGGPALLQLPILLWARFSPQVDTADGFGVAGEVRYAVGRPPFDAGGATYEDSESYALLVGYRKSRFEVSLTGAYQEAAARSYRGLEAGGGVSVLLLRSMGLSLGAEALGRVGGVGRDAAPSWIAAASLKFNDEHGSAPRGADSPGGARDPPRSVAAERRS